MHKEKLELTEKDILEKEFSIDARGFRMQEVDAFLDIIMNDYIKFNKIIAELLNDIKAITTENANLKNIIRELEAKLEAASTSEKQITNLDIIRRLANLEKEVFGSEQ